MLHQPLLRAVHHLVILLMLQQHPHHRALGHDGYNALRHPAVLRQVQKIIVKAGAVVGPNGLNAPLDGGGGEYAGRIPPGSPPWNVLPDAAAGAEIAGPHPAHI